MEYLIIIILQLIGIGFHIGQSIVALGDKFPNETPTSTFKTFFKEDWDTLMISGLVLLLDVMIHVVMDYLDVDPFTEGWMLYAPFAFALVMGYAGQRIIYKFFGTAEKFLNKQTDRLQ